MTFDKNVQRELDAIKEQERELRPKGKISRTHKIKRFKLKLRKLLSC